MEVEHKPKDVAGSYSKDPDAELDAALKKNYVNVRFQQGKPILDRELNLLGGLSSPRRLAQWYIGNGVPAGDDGFLISDVKFGENDFTIKHGRILVNGYEAVLDADTSYKSQPLIGEALAFNFNDDGGGIYDVHLHVDTREVSSLQDHDLENDKDIGFETALREQVIWKVLVTKTGTLTDQHMNDLCLLARVDSRKTTPEAQRVVDQRVKGITLAGMQQKATTPVEDLTLNTLTVKNKLDVGVPAQPPSATTLDAASKAAAAATAAAESITALYYAINAPDVLAYQQDLGFSPDEIKGRADKAKAAADAATAAVNAASGSDAAQVSVAAHTASEQAQAASAEAEAAAATGQTVAQGIGSKAAGDQAIIKTAESVRVPSDNAAQSATAATAAATTATTAATALDAAIATYNAEKATLAAAKVAVTGDAYMRGNLSVNGKIGIGTSSSEAKLQIINANQGAGGDTLILGSTAQSNLRLGYHQDYSWVQSHGNKPLAINPIGNNVGIGTTTPGQKLDVAGSVAADNLSVARDNEKRGALFLAVKGDFNHALYNNYSNADGEGQWDGAKWNTFAGLQIRTGAGASKVTALSISDNGNVGIGTTTPSTAKLVISGTAGLTGLDMASTDQYAEMRVIRNSLNAGDKDLYLQWQAGAGSKVHLYSNNTETMTLNAGNVGIGTSPDPRVKLDVAGAANIWSGERYAVANNFMAAGSLTIGSIKSNFGGGNGWNGNTAGLLLEALDNTEIAVHDSGTRITSLMYFEGGTNTNRITVGRDMGWGAVAQVNINGNVGIGTPTPGFPLSFPNVLGNKIAFWGQSGYNYGIGVQGSLLQLYTDVRDAGIAFGWGKSEDFHMTARLEGNGRIGTMPGHMFWRTWTDDASDPSVYFHGWADGITSTWSRFRFRVKGSRIDVGNGSVASIEPDGVHSNLVNVSDVRLKKDITPLANPADKLLSLRGVSFKWKGESENESPHLGLIAQEVEKFFPEVVSTDSAGIKGISATGLLAPLIEAFKQQHRELEQMRAEISQLKKRRV